MGLEYKSSMVCLFYHLKLRGHRAAMIWVLGQNRTGWFLFVWWHLHIHTRQVNETPTTAWANVRSQSLTLYVGNTWSFSLRVNSRQTKLINSFQHKLLSPTTKGSKKPSTCVQEAFSMCLCLISLDLNIHSVHTCNSHNTYSSSHTEFSQHTVHTHTQFNSSHTHTSLHCICMKAVKSPILVFINKTAFENTTEALSAIPTQQLQMQNTENLWISNVD